MKTFLPIQSQPPLKPEQFLLHNPTLQGEEVPMDVVFVGAGPAGMAGAIHLANLIKKDNAAADGLGEKLGDIQIGVLDKSANLGGHILSGAVMNPKALYELFPEMKPGDFPHHGAVKGDRVYFMTENSYFRMPTPPTMHNQGNYVVSLAEFVRWLGEKAEGLGVNILTSFPADSLLIRDNVVSGVRTTPAGLNRQGQPGAQYMSSNDITARLTVLTEGTRGPLAQAYLDWQKIDRKAPQIFALGVKELWRVKKMPEFVTHTLGHPLPLNAFGGSWLYPMGEDKISFGLVAGLDYKQSQLDVHQLLQKLKSHPLFSQYLEGGELLEWGAKTIPEGGWNAIPNRMHGDGIIIAGDTAGFVNVPALKGIHYAMKSGIAAAESAFDALKKNDFSRTQLSSYDQKIHSSYIRKDLHKVRNMRSAFKSGFFSGSIKAGLMTVTGGAFPNLAPHTHEDAAEEKLVADAAQTTITTKSKFEISKVDGVYRAGNKTRDDIPSHLTIGKDISPEVADMYVAMCPAGVYERRGNEVIINAPNCVDCKATDVLGPRWQPREGGAGPDYKQM
jgi:electron-transferring-flavoprotein dehydrogenase